MLKLVSLIYGTILGISLVIVLLIASVLENPEGIEGGIPDKVEGIPGGLLDAYAQAAESTEDIRPKCKGMRWSVLAGIGKVESNHLDNLNSYDIDSDGDVTPAFYGPTLNGDGVAAIDDTDDGKLDDDTTWDRAVGPMQFIPNSWETFGQDGNNDDEEDPNNVYDATLATAAHLCGDSEHDFEDREDLKEAVHSYNPGGGSSPEDNQYVADVLDGIDKYDALSSQADAENYSEGASSSATTAIEWAKNQEGTPYVFGGNCTDPNEVADETNCDCSSLAQQAYKAAGINLSRTTSSQWYEDTEKHPQIHPESAKLTKDGLSEIESGDLLYFDTGGPGGNPSHMGIYLGGTEMIHAPNSRETVKVVDLFNEKGGYYADRYRGAMRPWADK